MLPFRGILLVGRNLTTDKMQTSSNHYWLDTSQLLFWLDHCCLEYQVDTAGLDTKQALLVGHGADRYWLDTTSMVRHYICRHQVDHNTRWPLDWPMLVGHWVYTAGFTLGRPLLVGHEADTIGSTMYIQNWNSVVDQAAATRDWYKTPMKTVSSLLQS